MSCGAVGSELLAALAGDCAGFEAVKDCGRAIALLMLAQRLNHGTYNVSTGRLVR